MKLTTLTFTLIICFVSLTTARPRRTQTIAAPAATTKLSVKAPKVATQAQASAGAKISAGAKATIKAPKVAPKSTVKATVKLPAVELPKPNATAKVSVKAPTAAVGVKVSAQTSGAVKPKGDTGSKAVVKAPTKESDLKGTCPQATFLSLRPSMTVYAKQLPMCGSLKTTCCAKGMMRNWVTTYNSWMKIVSATVWSITKLPAVNGLYLSNMNRFMQDGTPASGKKRRLQSLLATPKVAIKATATPKVAIKATATPKVAIKLAATPQSTTKPEDDIKPVPSKWNSSQISSQSLFRKAWNYHNEIASKRELWTKDGLNCMKEYAKFKGRVACSVCDPKNEAIYSEALHIHTDSAKPMYQACVPWFQSFKYLNEMASLTFAYSIHVAGDKLTTSEKEFMVNTSVIDLTGCESDQKVTKSLEAKQTDKKRVLQQVVTPNAGTPNSSVTVDTWLGWVDAPFKPYEDKEVVIAETCTKNNFMKKFVYDWLLRVEPVFLISAFKPAWVGYNASIKVGTKHLAAQSFKEFRGDGFLPVSTGDMSRILQATDAGHQDEKKEKFVQTGRIDNKGLKLDAYKNTGLEIKGELAGLSSQKGLLASSLMKIPWVALIIGFAAFWN